MCTVVNMTTSAYKVSLEYGDVSVPSTGDKNKSTITTLAILNAELNTCSANKIFTLYYFTYIVTCCKNNK